MIYYIRFGKSEGSPDAVVEADNLVAAITILDKQMSGQLGQMTELRISSSNHKVLR